MTPILEPNHRSRFIRRILGTKKSRCVGIELPTNEQINQKRERIKECTLPEAAGGENRRRLPSSDAEPLTSAQGSKARQELTRPGIQKPQGAEISRRVVESLPPAGIAAIRLRLDPARSWSHEAEEDAHPTATSHVRRGEATAIAARARPRGSEIKKARE